MYKYVTVSIQSSVVLCSCPSLSMVRPKTEPSLSPGIPSGVSREGSIMDGTTTEARPSTNPLQQHPAQLLPQSPKKHPQDFKFRKIFGKGSFSTVIVAREVATSREYEYAIKILEKCHIIKENKVLYVTRDRRDVTPQSPLLCETLHFRTMKSLSYAKNGELLKYIRKFGSFDETCTQFYTAEIVSVLENLHGKGIIHRELKPQNILLNEDTHIQITDFGTAKGLSTENKQAKANTFVGTAWCVSPGLLTEKSACKSSDFRL